MNKITLTDEEILHVAKLASLFLSTEEIEKFKPQLISIIDFISKLSDIDTSKVLANTKTTNLVNVFREDKIDPERQLTQDEALSNALETHNGYFKIPAVFD